MKTAQIKPRKTRKKILYLLTSFDNRKAKSTTVYCISLHINTSTKQSKTVRVSDHELPRATVCTELLNGGVPLSHRGYPQSSSISNDGIFPNKPTIQQAGGASGDCRTAASAARRSPFTLPGASLRRVQSSELELWGKT